MILVIVKYRSYRKVDEIAFFVPGKFCSKGLELSLKLSHELTWKVRVDKERNSRISLALLLHNVWFQKISIPPPRRELEIPRGRGGQRPRKFWRGGGLERSIWFPDALRFNTDSKILSYLLSRSFT